MRSGEHLACSRYYVSSIAEGEPLTDIADDPGGLSDLVGQHNPEVKGRPRIYSVQGPSLYTRNCLDAKTKETEAGL